MKDAGATWRLAVRRLARDRALSLLVVVSLSLGIGATATVFSLVNALFFRPIAGVGEPDALVALTPRPVEIPGLPGSFHVPLPSASFRAYQRSDALSGLAAYQPVIVHAAVGELAARLDAEAVSANYFSVLRVSPRIGRVFSPDTGIPGAWPNVAVVGHGLWSSWGGEADLIGETVQLNGIPFTVVGVAPEGFHGPRLAAPTEVWVPLDAAHRIVPGLDRAKIEDSAHGWLFWFVGRLRDGATPALAQESLDAIAAGLAEQGLGEQAAGLVVDEGIGLRPDEERSARQALTVLISVSAFLLLTACLNTAVLLLSRIPLRRKDTSVRLALGAQRSQVVREVFAESSLLGLAGALGGTLLALPAARFLSTLDFAGFLPAAGRVVVDLRVLAFAICAGLAATVLSGIVPALRSSGIVPATVLQAGRSGGRGGERLQHLLVIAQVGVSLVLMIGAGLLTRSLWNHERIAPGFDVERVLNVRFDLERQGYDEAAGRAFHRRVLDEVKALPGVESVSLASSVPLTRAADRQVAQVVARSGPVAGEAASWIGYNVVGPEYLRTLGIELLRGRELTMTDGANSPRVAVVNERLAELFWPDRDPVGQWIGFDEQDVRVVGVAANSRTETLTGPVTPHFYLPISQHYRPAATLHVRSRQPATLLDSVEDRIAELDPRLPLFSEGLMRDELSAALTRPRLAATFVGLAALLGLFLSTVGIAGVTYRNAVARAWESSVRLAVGAERSDLVWLHLRRGLVTVGIGLLVGCGGALLISRVLTSLLYGVSPQEPAVLTAVIALVLVIAVLASAVPAYVASRIDPARILQQD